MNALRQLLLKLSTDAPLNGDDIVALLLLMTMLASTGHLLTMLATRWGDSYITLKSLIASILIHGACFLSLELFDVRAAGPRLPPVPPPEPPVSVVHVLVESDHDILLSESGNTPLADRPTQPDLELARISAASVELTPPELPDQQPDQLESLSTAAEDVALHGQQDSPELAAAVDSGSLAPRQPAAADPAADVQTTYERNTADLPTLQLSRTRPQAGSAAESPPEPVPAMPIPQAPELEFDAEIRDVAPVVVPADTSDIAVPASASESESQIERRSAPAVSPDATDAAGLALNPPEPRAGPGAAIQRRLPRPSRSVEDQKPDVRPSRESVRIPRTPTPLAADYDDVRIGLAAPDFSEALTSSARLLDSDLPVIRRRENPPVTYQLRNTEQRREAARKFGGTQQSEAAVELSLRWLAANQQPDGRWDAEDFGAGQVKVDEFGIDRNFAGREADTGLTALVTLCFLGAGYTHEHGRYAVEVDRSLDWLIQQQGDNGNLCGQAEHFARMYCHGMATYALAEAYGMQQQTLLGPIVDPVFLKAADVAASRCVAFVGAGVTGQPLLCWPLTDSLHELVGRQNSYALRKVDDIRLRSALARAVTFTIGQQDPRSGGWRYKLGQEGDVSMFGWQMMSLKSAEIAGVRIDDRVRSRMDHFLNSVRQGQHGGLFAYRRHVSGREKDAEPVTPAMTAEALFCQQMLGYPRDTAASQEAVGYLLNHLPQSEKLNYYYWYYGTLSMYQYGGTPWDKWNAAVRDRLIAIQQTDGELAGSWDPNDPWGRYGGRLYSTALATLTLEVYYRLLPLYRLNDLPDRVAP